MQRLHKGSLVTTLQGVTATSRRFQADGASSRSRRAFDNPLTGKDPAMRSVMVPDAFHSNIKSELPQGADALRQRAMKTMARRQAEEMLWQGVAISDTTNPLVKALKAARDNPKFRQSRRMVVAGGRLFLEELAGHSIYPETLLLPSGAEVPAWAEKGNCEIIPITDKVAQSIDEGGDGYIGNFKMPEPPGLDELVANKQRLDRVLVLDNVSDPGNLGTLLRTASAFAFDAIILTNHCADLYHHAVVRAARGVHFMKNVKIYVLREEDGDDAFAMVNHVVTRNELEAVAYTPAPFKESANRLDSADQYTETPGSLLPTSLFGTKIKPAAPSPAPSPAATAAAAPAAAALSNAWVHTSPAKAVATADAGASAQKLPSNAATAKKLFSFMVDTFVSTAKPSAASSQPAAPRDHFKDKGFMLYAGPDTKCNMVRRLEQRVSKPTTVLQLDSEEDALGLEAPASETALSLASSGDMMTALPSIMYALRPNGHWDYLLPSERSDPNVTTVGKGTVQIGPDYMMVDLPGATAEEQEAHATQHLNWKKNKRQLARMRTDEGYWLRAENNNAHFKGIKKLNRAMDPLAQFTGQGKKTDSYWDHRIEKDGRLAEDIPDITSDYNEIFDRDYLRNEQQNSEQLSRAAPSLYDKKMWYENSSGVQRQK